MPTTPEAAQAARQRIAGFAIRTPLVRLNTDGLELPNSIEDGAGIYLKLESLQPICSFKIRGAANAILQASKRQLAKGVLTASAGNMAQGVAYCARRLGIPATVVTPDSAPETKLRAVERLGGRVIKVPFDKWWNTFETRSYPGVDGLFVHAFDDPEVMAGNGTIALEILEDMAEPDAIVVPWGGGGLACGIAAVAKALRPGVKVFAAESENGAPLAASLKAGKPTAVDYRPSFVDGIASKTVFPGMFELAKQLLDGSMVMKLEQISAAMRFVAERNRIIIEGAAAAAVAAAMSGRAGKGRIVAIVSGGNIDLETFSKLTLSR
ncbi:MAG TPA: threonine/serine dehydratase [Bryobacteraceae bacterium]|nr:threonine/serine dehydratase [Bryobacteraceae bacterium]